MWTFLSVLAAAAIVQPDNIAWLHPRDALPVGPWWECARELVTPRVARDVPLGTRSVTRNATTGLWELECVLPPLTIEFWVQDV